MKERRVCVCVLCDMDEFASGVFSPVGSPLRNLQRTYSDRFVPSRTGSDLNTYALELASEENAASAPQVDREVRVGCCLVRETLRAAWLVQPRTGCLARLFTLAAHGAVDLMSWCVCHARGCAGHEQPGVWGGPP